MHLCISNLGTREQLIRVYRLDTPLAPSPPSHCTITYYGVPSPLIIVQGLNSFVETFSSTPPAVPYQRFPLQAVASFSSPHWPGVPCPPCPHFPIHDYAFIPHVRMTLRPDVGTLSPPRRVNPFQHPPNQWAEFSRFFASPRSKLDFYGFVLVPSGQKKLSSMTRQTLSLLPRYPRSRVPQTRSLLPLLSIAFVKPTHGP